jgi:hypothetical protein
MAQLSHYKDNLFASHATMESAIEYVSMMANTFTTENSLAVITAARVVLNTAIELHKAELAAVNRPLIELIDARVAAALMELKGSLEDMETNLDDKITEAINDMDIDDKIQGWYDSNFDIESALSGTSISISFD